MLVSRRVSRGRLLATACACAFLLPSAASAAGYVLVGNSSPGPTPFIADIEATVGGAPLAAVTFGIVSKPGSLVLPIVATYTANYLSTHGYLAGSDVTVPAWGLYAGSNNTVVLLFTFADGSNAVAVKPVTTASYMDPCAPINAPVLQQNRKNVSDIGFNYFILKNYCSTNSPAIVDTDANLRWVGTANVGSVPATLYNNGIYVSDGASGIKRIELTGQVSQIADFAPVGVNTTNEHNMDPGRNGIVVEVGTTTSYESVALEFDPSSGKVLNTWDMGQIIAAAMTAGGDDPNNFIGPLGSDWFHMNATTYDPADNTEIISSRENFAIDVDYDTPPDGVKKIHWILGDTTKKWAVFSSLKKYALSLGPNTLPPIGQHAVSINLQGDLMLFDDGNASDYEKPAGLQRGYSAGRSYAINTATMTATEIINYTPEPHIFAPFCGSFYEPAPNSYLIDFATADGETSTDIQGLGINNKLVFDLKYGAAQTCGAGWNALPLANIPLFFN